MLTSKLGNFHKEGKVKLIPIISVLRDEKDYERLKRKLKSDYFNAITVQTPTYLFFSSILGLFKLHHSK